MMRIILCGCNGKMGKAVTEAVAKRDDCTIVAGVDIWCESRYGYPVYARFSDVDKEADVIIDFSDPSLLSDLLSYAVKANIPCVECTTGFAQQHVQMLKNAAERIPVFYSGNMSLGVNLMTQLSKIAARVLGNSFDIEIIEKHHNTKIDAPSGTALMLADVIASELPNGGENVYERHSVREKRRKNEIGIHSVRGGNMVGEHEVLFIGDDEVISIKHTAQSKTMFAVGAINAAHYLIGKEKGCYSMNDLVMNKHS